MNDEQLIALYFDDCLDAEERTEVENRLSKEPELKALYQEHVQLKELMVEAHEARMADVDLSDFTNQVMSELPTIDFSQSVEFNKNIDFNKSQPDEVQQVIQISPSAESTGIFHWFKVNMSGLMVGAVAATALLAGARLLMQPKKHAVELNQIKSSSENGTISISHPNGKADAASVIWVEDDESLEAGAEGEEL